MLRTFRRGAALLVATTGLTALAGPAGAQSGPNDIDFMGTKKEGGRKCEVFEPPFEGRYCPAGAARMDILGSTCGPISETFNAS
jgi:hypothetical protein